jgi:hypothetical protein
VTKAKTDRPTRLRPTIKIGRSEPTRQRHLARRVDRPIAITGIGEGKHVLLQPRDFKRLGVDERYQRVRITSQINTLIHVIRSGGVIPDPVSIARRPDDSLWIVDGQQRFWAHSETDTPMRAMIYDVPDFETERLFFIALNQQAKINPNHTVKAWDGEGAEFIRSMADKPGSPLVGRIHFSSGSPRPLSSGILARGICRLLADEASPTAAHKDIKRVLAHLDTWIKRPGARERAYAYCVLLAAVFLEGHKDVVRRIPVEAFAAVAAEKWKTVIVMPPPVSMGLFKRANWAGMAPGHSVQFLPVFEAEIRKRWRA